ncbi:hypothetical protein D9M69_503710 [compost metagenome]
MFRVKATLYAHRPLPHHFRHCTLAADGHSRWRRRRLRRRQSRAASQAAGSLGRAARSGPHRIDQRPATRRIDRRRPVENLAPEQSLAGLDRHRPGQPPTARRRRQIASGRCAATTEKCQTGAVEIPRPATGGRKGRRRPQCPESRPGQPAIGRQRPGRAPRSRPPAR